MKESVTKALLRLAIRLPSCSAKPLLFWSDAWGDVGGLEGYAGGAGLCCNLRGRVLLESRTQARHEGFQGSFQVFFVQDERAGMSLKLHRRGMLGGW